jgi:hypothetical protein
VAQGPQFSPLEESDTIRLTSSAVDTVSGT